MALTENDLTHVSFPITKFEEDADGNLVVYGKVTDGTVDSDKQIVDPKWSAKALGDWMDSGPNVRVMHSPALYPAGRGLKVETGPDGHFLRSLVVEDTAKKLVRNKVLRAYSVGIGDPVITKDITGKAPGGIVSGGYMAEVSLVDRPANKNCQLVLAKSEELEVPWSYGDLQALAAASDSGDGASGDGGPVATADLTKVSQTQVGKAAPPDDEEDTEDTEDPGDEAAEDAVPADTTGGRKKPAGKAVTGPTGPATDPVGAWTAARAAWLGREPAGTGVAGSATEYLSKRAEWQRWHVEGETGGLLEDGYPLWLTKRNVDPGVGGGVDRDTIPAEDFAGPDRTYPIVTPKDVKDAAGLVGHADDPDAVKKRIIAIARRKGPRFEAELPESWTGKTADADLGKTTDGGGTDGGDGSDAAVVKGGDKDCPKCGKTYHADSKQRRCEGCGTKLPQADAGKAGKKKPGKNPTGPDGDNADAGGGPAVKTAGKPAYGITRMHDALCAAYHPDDVTAEYPALKGVGDAVVPGWWVDQIAKATTDLDLDVIGALVELAKAAEAVKGSDPDVIADARALVHKAFADMYPDTRVTPTSMSPGRFQRPYVSAGHAPLSGGGGRSARIPGSNTPDPDQFDRGPLTAGHQDPPPGSTPGNEPAGSGRSGAARTFYTRASRDSARAAMQAMHDHIAGTFPDLCPLAATKSVMPPDMSEGSVPTPVTMPTVPDGPGGKAAAAHTVKTGGTHTGKPKKAGKAGRPAPTADLADLIKTAAAEAATAAATAVQKRYEPQFAELRRELDELGAQPDPTQAPVRGVVRKTATTDDDAPVERVSLVEKAQEFAADDRAAQAAWLSKMAAGHPDPDMRDRCEQALNRLLSTP